MDSKFLVSAEKARTATEKNIPEHDDE